MECYKCGRAAGAACVDCGLAVCNNHRSGNKCLDRKGCGEIVKRELIASVRELEAPHGRCFCDESLFKHPRDAKSRPGRCPEHGYTTTEKTATTTR